MWVIARDALQLVGMGGGLCKILHSRNGEWLILAMGQAESTDLPKSLINFICFKDTFGQNKEESATLTMVQL